MKLAFQVALISCGLLIAGAVVPIAQAKPKAKAKINFSRDVKPILSQNCFKCHGPDAGTVAAGLRLDTFEGATKDRGGKQAIVPGKPAESRLIIKINHDNEDLRMPPPDAGLKPLTDQQKETLRAWIAEGGKYEKHWSLVPPSKPALPEVSNPKWARNPIDQFVLARLDEEGLKPEAEADKETLISRVSLSLTGLPPEPQEIEKFLADKSPNAYEKMVDRYLASPRYGEHQARYWLDAVRYGDTHGLHLDNERAIYPYRDWVIKALNRDLPFDQFTVWQMAGDMLPNPTNEQRVATGYIRMNPTTNEGGAIEAEFLAKNTFDRVDTTSTVFLGMTVACARCHDHKYDPIKQKDYYSLYAFFNSTADSPLDGNDRIPAPVVRVTTPDDEAQIAAWDKEIAKLVASVKTADALAWLKSDWRPVLQTSGWEVSPAYGGKDFDEAFAKVFPAEPGAPAGEPVAWKPLGLKVGTALANVVAKENAAGYVRGVLKSSVAQEFPIQVSSDDGIKIWINGQLAHENKVLRGIGPVDQVKLKLVAGDNQIVLKVVNSGGPDGLLLTFGNADSERIDKIYTIWNDPAKAKDQKPEELAKLYLEVGTPTAAALRYRAVLAERNAFVAGLPQTLVAEELPKPREAFVLRRGEYNLPTDKVSRALPPALGELPKGAPVNRLGLAEWLISKDNPLVSRVFVNRVWQQHFGNGIVKTAEDFGSQGEWPVNPELLDYLAVTFRDQGWSIKKLHRLIVTSATFRQRSSADKGKLAKDPENRLTSRGPRFRLDAEVLRDRALAASGLLIEKIGGPGFRPYQPDGLWEAIAFQESNTARYAKESGPGIYRRSLYMFWKRTSPHPIMLSFDAPMRESCSVRRSRTNTPLQALVTLNEPAFLEASRALAQRVIDEETKDDQRLSLTFMLTVGREPTHKERALLGEALTRYRVRFLANPSDAEEMLRVGDSKRATRIPAPEHAAWMLICSTLMNTDEFLTLH
ncbi:MAG: PSD1 and planctomycete cytochrome C domain-containing protein [Fimbriimonadaceae bacterium]|nr:PSD1 and planctomycete cytochrome C domain-containing protein [Fimbriimonadaceae bacterium]